jgi:alpha-tubulin suppressor-like RCC1 family protein
MLSRKLLGSGATDALQRNFLYVWGIGGAFQELGFIPNPEDEGRGNDSPFQVSSQRIYNAVNNSVSPYSILDSAKRLYFLGSAFSSLPQNNVIHPNSWKQIAVGTSHTLAIRSDNKLFAWGLQSSSVLGTGGGTTSSPVQVGNSLWSQVATGAQHSIGITVDGQLFGWGSNNSGQIRPQNEVSTLSTPSTLTLGSLPAFYKSVAAVNDTSFVIREDGVLFTLGSNNFNLLGDPSVPLGSNTKTSFSARRLSGSWTQVSAGFSHVLAINSNNELYVWGHNSAGQLGLGDTNNRSFPTQVGIDSWSQIAAGRNHSMAIRSDGMLFTWGSDTSAQLGQSVPDIGEARSSPIQISTESWTQIAASLNTSFAIRPDGSLWSWGASFDGILGKTVSIFLSPTQIDSSSWTNVFASGAGGGVGGHAFAIKNDNTLYAWGFNGSGQLGVRDTITRSSPTLVGQLRTEFALRKYSEDKWNKVSTTVSNGSAISESGDLYIWGQTNDFGFTSGTRSSPTLVQTVSGKWKDTHIGNLNLVALREDGRIATGGFTGEGRVGFDASPASTVSFGTYIPGSWTQVSSDGNKSLAIDTSGLLYGWGVNYPLPSELPESTQFKLYEDNFIFDSDNVVSWAQVSASISGRFTLGLRSDGTLYGWGNNQWGQLGTNNTTSRSSPVKIGTSSWSQVSAGGLHSVGITVNGTLFAWGNNGNGQLGDNTRVSRSQPWQLPSLSSWTQVSAGTFHTMAIDVNNRLFAWGAAGSGQLGTSSNVPRSSPVQVGTSSWTQVSAAEFHTLGIRSDGILFAWGQNLTQGILGINSTNTGVFNSPQQLGTSTWSQVAASFWNSYAIRSDGALFGWGDNSVGQIGIGVTGGVYRSPILISSSSWTNISSGQQTLFAIRNDGSLFACGVGTNGQLGTGALVNNNVLTQIGGEYKSVSGGQFHVGFIRSDDILVTSGFNSNGELGIFNTVQQSSPVVVQKNDSTKDLTPQQIGNKSWKQTFVGLRHVMAIDDNDDLYSWGRNDGNQLGYGTLFNTVQDEPRKVELNKTLSWSANTFSGFANGTTPTASTYYFIRSDGALYAWGSNAFGQLGLNNTVYRSNPTQVGKQSWTQISTGDSFAMAIRSDGLLFAWGNNVFGRLGTGNLINTSSPVQIGSSSWTQVSVGQNHVAAIRSDGLLFTWGHNTVGELGDNTRVSSSSPVQIGTSSWSQVSAAQSFTVAIDNNGRLFTWGNNNIAQLGSGNAFLRSSPVQVGTSSWTQISTASTITSAITAADDLFSWGNFVSSPTQVGSEKFSKVTVGPVRQYALTTNGDLYSYTTTSSGVGNITLIEANTQINGIQTARNGTAVSLFVSKSPSANITNELFYLSTISIGRYASTSTLEPVPGTKTYSVDVVDEFNSANLEIEKVTLGGNHSLAIVRNKTNRNISNLYGWGLNDSGQLGFERTLTNNLNNPDYSWSQVSVGRSVTCAIRSDGLLFAWGLNNAGEVGDGTLIARSSPVQIGTSSWSQVSSGTNHVLAIRSDGILFAWGNASNGRLGDGTTVNRSSPVQIGSSSWTQVSAGAGHNLAINTNGSLFAWGINGSGQLGTNDTINRSSPTQIGSSSWTQVSAGGNHNIAILIDGNIFTWGLNSTGQLGTGDTAPRSSPVSVGGGLSFSQVSAGSNHTAAIRGSNLALYTWGGNALGQLGASDTIDRSSGVLIPGSWTQVSAGASFTAALGFNTPQNTGSESLLHVWGTTTTGVIASARSSPVVINATPFKSVSVETTGIAAISNSTSLIYVGGSNSGRNIPYGTTLFGLFPLRINSVTPVYDPSTTTLEVPTKIDNSNTWNDVSAGPTYTYGLKKD